MSAPCRVLHTRHLPSKRVLFWQVCSVGTRQLGPAFTSDQKEVLDAVQRLRGQAWQVGNLKSTPRLCRSSTQCLSLPLRRRHRPVRKEGTVSTGAAVAGGLVAFGVATSIGSALHSDDDWCPRWRAGTVYVSASR